MTQEGITNIYTKRTIYLMLTGLWLGLLILTILNYHYDESINQWFDFAMIIIICISLFHSISQAIPKGEMKE